MSTTTNPQMEKLSQMKDQVVDKLSSVKDSVMEKMSSVTQQNPQVQTQDTPLKPGERRIKGWASFGPHQDLKEWEYIAAPLGPTDVGISITHCGICHTDIAMMQNDLKMSVYPFIPGHEIVGVVTELGPDVKHLKMGMRVGVGWNRRTCRACEFCKRGDDNVCPDAVCVMLNGEQGGFAEHIRVDSFNAYPIPDALPSEQAAPLLDAAATVWSPLSRFNINSSHKIGVIGFGGLGHLLTKIAVAMGCEVTVFTTSAEKEEEIKSFGAHRIIKHEDKAAMKEITEKLDFVASTLYVPFDYAAYMNVLKADGIFCLMGWTPVNKPIEIPVYDLIYKQRKVVGSNVCSSARMVQMLDFCARHNIFTETEVYDWENINEAINKFKKTPKNMHFRAVMRVGNRNSTAALPTNK